MLFYDIINLINLYKHKTDAYYTIIYIQNTVD